MTGRFSGPNGPFTGNLKAAVGSGGPVTYGVKLPDAGMYLVCLEAYGAAPAVYGLGPLWLSTALTDENNNVFNQWTVPYGPGYTGFNLMASFSTTFVATVSQETHLFPQVATSYATLSGDTLYADHGYSMYANQISAWVGRFSAVYLPTSLASSDSAWTQMSYLPQYLTLQISPTAGTEVANDAYSVTSVTGVQIQTSGTSPNALVYPVGGQFAWSYYINKNTNSTLPPLSGGYSSFYGTNAPGGATEVFTNVGDTWDMPDMSSLVAAGDVLWIMGTWSQTTDVPNSANVVLSSNVLGLVFS